MHVILPTTRVERVTWATCTATNAAPVALDLVEHVRIVAGDDQHIAVELSPGAHVLTSHCWSVILALHYPSHCIEV